MPPRFLGNHALDPSRYRPRKYIHSLVARYIGSTREVVSRMLKYFASEGILEVSRKGITILDRQKLRRLTL